MAGDNASTRLRAPDPTLDAMDAKWGVVSIEDGDPPTAHEMDPGDRCDPGDHFKREWSRYARWYAVPCHLCFPEAPPRGQRTPGGDHPPADLAWQVPDAEQRWQPPEALLDDRTETT